MPLSDLKLRALRAKPVAGKHGDRDGLFVRINKAGSMSWQWRIHTPSGENSVSYGTYPDVSLAEARQRHADARRQWRDGINPNDAKRAAKLASKAAAASSFEAVTREWFEHRKDEWAASYADKIIRRMENDLFPYIGRRAIVELDAPTILLALRRIETRGARETAHRALENCGQVFRYAVATGRISSDPTRDLKGALKKPVVKHFAAVTKPEKLAELLRMLHSYSGTPVVRAALQLAPMLMLRPGELRHARWEEFDFSTATWTIPAARMKRGKDGKLHGAPHIVPLPRQAVAVLLDLHPLTGPAGMVFRGERDHERPMSENTINAAMQRMGIDTENEATGHGFRATARTILDEHLGFDRAVIEAQLAHSVADSLGRAYNRTEFLVKRREMLQAWANYLEGLRLKPPKSTTAKPRSGLPQAKAPAEVKEA